MLITLSVTGAQEPQLQTTALLRCSNRNVRLEVQRGQLYQTIFL